MMLKKLRETNKSSTQIDKETKGKVEKEINPFDKVMKNKTSRAKAIQKRNLSNEEKSY